jgi:Domain of unknown function (DUF4262)
MSVPRRTVATMRLKLRKRSSDCEADSPDLSYMQWILSQVSASGWAVPGVHGGGIAPPWAYSIGLWATFGHPDLAAFGRPLDQLAVIVKSLCRRVADDEAVSAGDVLDDVCPGMLAIRAIHDSWRMTPLFHASDQFHGYIRPPIYQVAWADADGNFPGDLRYDPALADAQPMLWLPVDDHPPGPWTRLGLLD